MMIDSPAELHALARLASGEPLNGERQSLTGPVRRLADQMDEIPAEARQVAFQGFKAAFGDELAKALASIDPAGPPPEAEPAERCATLSDLRRLVADDQWLWKGWLAVGVLNGLAADPGTGKTILAVELARRMYSGLSWPDGQANSLPERSRTLWVPGDRHYSQLLDLAGRFGLPDEAMLFNSPPSDPTAGLDLDDPAELAALADRIRAEQPGLVIVDTVGMTTAKNLCKPEDAREYFGPLMDMARETQTAFLMLTHLSKDGQALGRRITGTCRLVWKMTDPDPEGQPGRRRLWVDKSYAEKPPALGMSIGNDGCDFNFKPPDVPAPGKPGRPPEARAKAGQFIREALTQANDRTGNELAAEFEETGGTGKTFWRAVREMVEAGELAKDGGPGTGKQVVLHLIDVELVPDKTQNP
jgi:hypothetical protein